VETSASVDNQWLGVGYTLICDETGDTVDFGREVSYYHGYEDGESWTEGARADAVTLPAIPAGRYFLRIEPESDRSSKPIPYQVTVVRGAVTSLWFLAALVLLLLPPVLTSWRALSFERRRWEESGGLEPGDVSTRTRR
jgi:hypothetical protein